MWLLVSVLVAGCGVEERSSPPLRTSSDLKLDTANEAAFLQAPSNPFGAKGPFEIGFSYLRFVDAARPSSTGDGGRPITAFLFYPVDPRSITSESPEASYPLDPVFDQAPHATSSQFELGGIDRAYQDARVSREGPFPLFVFSSGWGLDASSYVFLNRIASHGIVVAVLSHDGDPTPLIANVDPILVMLVNRPRDVSFAITSLLADSRSWSSPRSGLIRPGGYGVGGHSAGGYAGLTLAGGDDSVCDVGIFGDPLPGTCVPIARDPHVRVVLHLEGTNEGLKFSELARIRVPTMGIGENVEALAAQDPGMVSYDARPHAAIASASSYRVDIAHVHHVYLSNLCVLLGLIGQSGILPVDVADFYHELYCGSPNEILAGDTLLEQREVFRLIDGYAAAFLKVHLARDLGAERFLMPSWTAAHEPNARFFTTERCGDQHAGPGLTYLNPEWTDEFDYYAHQPSMTPLPCLH
jgi:hypothetical protein